MVLHTFLAPLLFLTLFVSTTNAETSKAIQQSATTINKKVSKTKKSASSKKSAKKPTPQLKKPVRKQPLAMPISPKHEIKKTLSKSLSLSSMPTASAGEPNKPLEDVYTSQANSIQAGDHAHTPTLVPTKSADEAIKDDDEDNETADDDDEDEEADDDDDIESPTPAPPNKKIMIRVLLKEAPTTEKVTFTIQSKKGFVLESSIGSGKRASWKHEILNLLAYQNNLFLLTTGGTYKRIKANELAIASVAGDLKIDNFRYTGTVYLRIDPKTKMIQMVNKVNLDDYIYAVLRYESLSYWPLEMQKVQAVASRSYAVRQIKTARSNSTVMPFYDIKNNNFHQVYNGNHDYVHLRKAVDQTHNLILTYNGDIALTMFDICCGGIIPGNMKKKDADKPYLYRKTRCTYCHNKANYEWDCAFDKDTLLQRMLDNPKVASKAKKIGKITGIALKEKDKANIVHRVLIHGSRNNISFTNNEFKSALGARAKSNAYTVKKRGDDIVVHGYGFGHNMGLCQIGARELVSRDWDYHEILHFYFPKTRLMRLKVI